LILGKAVHFDDNIRPVCLPEAPSPEADHLTGTSVSVSRWCKTNELALSASDTLKTVHISVYNQR